MPLHPSFKPLLAATPSGFMYLQHELSDHIDIERLEKMMRRIILKFNELNKDDRRTFAPVFTFEGVDSAERSYIRMHMHRPAIDGKPDTILGHFDFLQVMEGQFPTLDLVINKWGLLSCVVHKDLTAHNARNVMNSLMDYMGPVEYAMGMAPIKQMLKLPPEVRAKIHFTIEVTTAGVNVAIMRLDKILMTHQVFVENKEV